MTTIFTVDTQTARRFILGKQGLWPGRRWRGVDGTEQAMTAMEYLQLDPLQIIARSHDIALNSRVIDYLPGMWKEPTYARRRFFDWGGWLATRSMEELPHWRVVMRRERDTDRRLLETAGNHSDAIAEMHAVLAERGTVTNRDFPMKTRTRTENYRGRKDSAVALYYLWRTGEVMTHNRENFERVYALTETVAPEHLLRESEEAEADRFVLRKEVGFEGLTRLNASLVGGEALQRSAPYTKEQLVERMLDEGEIIAIRVENWRSVHYALSGDAGLLHEIAAGRIPEEWTPLDTTTVEEVSFLAPLDPVSARGRAKVLFGLDYVWEVYKPEAKRRFGYYALPVLWGDQLVARFDSRLDRTSNTYVILGFWLDDTRLGNDEAFAEALVRGFGRFLAFLGAEKLDAQAVREPLLRKRLQAGPWRSMSHD